MDSLYKLLEIFSTSLLPHYFVRMRHLGKGRNKITHNLKYGKLYCQKFLFYCPSLLSDFKEKLYFTGFLLYKML